MSAKTMQKLLLFCSFLLPVTTFAQQSPPNLADFFEQRLSSMPQPSYEELLRVIDPIASIDPKEVSAALPLFFSALRSSKENLPVEAAFALYEIAQRPDGGTLLRSRISEIAALLDRPDERLSGSAVLTLRFLTSSEANVTIPILIQTWRAPVNRIL